MKPWASEFAAYADNVKWIGIPYDQWDCQKFVEEMLRGVDAYHNWKGSNDMWRNAVTNKGTIKEVTLSQGGELLPGTWLFTIKNDGGEKDRGYNDNEGNAAHVGIYLGEGRVIHSTTGGVQWDVLTSRRWTHAGECINLDYGHDENTPTTMTTHIRDIIKSLEYIVSVLEDEHDNR